MACLSNDELKSMIPNAGNYGSRTDGVPEEKGYGQSILDYVKGIPNAFNQNLQASKNLQDQIFNGFTDNSSANRGPGYNQAKYGTPVAPPKPPELGIVDKIMNIPGDLYSGFNQSMEEAIPYANDLERMTLENLKTGKITLDDGTKVSGNVLDGIDKKYGTNIGGQDFSNIDSNIEAYKEQYKKDPTQRNKDLLENEKKKALEINTRLEEISTDKTTLLEEQAKKQKELDEYDVDSEVTGKTEVKNSLQMTKVIEDLVNNTKAAKPVTTNPKEVEEAGETLADKDPTLFEQVKTELSKFFNVGELVRASISYLGSRALGYDHGSSLNFVGKSYLTRVDSQLAANEKWAKTKDVTEKFTQSSIQDYLDSGGDRDKLIAKGKLPAGVNKLLDDVFDNDSQSILQTYQLNDKNKSTVVRMPNGQLLPLNDPQVIRRVSKLNASIHDPQKMKDNLFKAAKEFAKDVNVDKKAADKGYVSAAFSDTLSKKGYDILNRTLKRKGVNKDSAARSEIIGQINYAMGDVFSDLKNGKAATAKTLEAYFNSRVATIQTGGFVDYEDVKGYPKAFINLQKKIGALSKGVTIPEGRNRDEVQTAVYKGLWQNYKLVFDRYKARAAAGKLEGLPTVFLDAGQHKAGYNDFMNWIDKALSGNKDALQLMVLMNKE